MQKAMALSGALTLVAIRSSLILSLIFIAYFALK